MYIERERYTHTHVYIYIYIRKNKKKKENKKKENKISIDKHTKKNEKTTHNNKTHILVQGGANKGVGDRDTQNLAQLSEAESCDPNWG